MTGHLDAAALSAALGERAEEVCRMFLPKGRRSGRYWTVGDVHGTKGRSMWVRLEPPGVPGKWTDAATGEHGDLLDLVHHHVGGASLGPDVGGSPLVSPASWRTPRRRRQELVHR